MTLLGEIGSGGRHGAFQRRLGHEPHHIIELFDCPAVTISDNGTELMSHAILRWQEEARRAVAFCCNWQAAAEPAREELQRMVPG